MSISSIKKARREESILSALQKKKSLKTYEVANMLNVSECTARRFLEDLEKEGRVVRIYGGVKSAPSKHTEYHFENLQLRQSEQKQRIGAYGARLVDDGAIIFLDSGTTIQQMALHLVERFKNNDLHDVQVYTNSMRNLTILADYCEINLIGGLYRSKRKDFCGYLSEMMLESVSFQKCFLSADGVSCDPRDGIMATDIFTAKLNEIVSRRAEKAYLLSDSTKFVRRSFIKYASVSDMHMIVTDSGLSEAIREALIAQGVSVEIV